jgi:hypothetical protein
MVTLEDFNKIGIGKLPRHHAPRSLVPLRSLME